MDLTKKYILRLPEGTVTMLKEDIVERVKEILKNHPSEHMNAYRVWYEGFEGCGMPGTILKADKKGIVVACGRGAVRIGMVQGAGGKKMPADAFFRGHAALLSEIFR